jgi:hypothetical protein
VIECKREAVFLEKWNESTRNEVVTVGATSQQIANQGNAQARYFRNDSAAAQIITLNFGGQPAVANAGIVLSVGQFISDSDSEGYSCYKGIITAIASAAGATLSVFER